MKLSSLLQENLKEKLKEALHAVVPIIVIMLILSFTIAPISSIVLLYFLLGAVLLIGGMMLFTLGAEMSMSSMGEKVGSAITRSKKLGVIVGLSFLLGFLITISEPDLQVLAGLVPSIPNIVLILAVAVGVGIFLVIALLRMLFGIPLPQLLIGFYFVVFLLAFFVPDSFKSIAFDSGGVTTGPMTVPFIMAIGLGVSTIRNDRHASSDSFGLVALCSIGPILSVLLLGLIYRPQESDYALSSVAQIEDSIELGQLFGAGFLVYMKEIAFALLPIVIFFGIFQVVSLHLGQRQLTKIVIGLVYTYVGLVLFLTGANVGFVPAGSYLGEALGGMSQKWILVLVAMVMGYFIVKAEPAVYVLNKQVEEITDGAISAKAMGLSLSIGVAVSLGIAMIRVITGISIMWFLIPGYALALSISFFVPKIYTAIAFDSGGVASGPMATTFLLPLAQGACVAVGGNMVTDAFGVVAMVAMTPLITIQMLGIVSQLSKRRKKQTVPSVAPELSFELLDDDMIIEL